MKTAVASSPAPSGKPAPAVPESSDDSAERADAAATAAADAGDGNDADAKPDASGGAKASGAPGGDARLKAAVAAWVAGADDEEEEGTEPGASEDAGEGDKPAGKPAEKPAADQPTAVFRTRPASGDGDDAEPAEKPAGKPAEKPAADQPTAVFRTRPAKSGGDDDAEPAEKPAADQPTAVFKTVRPKGGEDDAESKPESKPSGDRPTAVLRTMPPKTDGKAADSKAAKGKSSDDKPADGKPADDEPVDQPTAVFRTVPAKDGKKDDKAGQDDKSAAKPAADKAKSDDQPTELLKAPTPLPTPGTDRKSQFVPLKKDDEAPAKGGAAKPAAAKSAPAKPAAAKPEPAKAAPGKPAIPVSVAPPAEAGRTQVPGVPQPPQGTQAPQQPQAPLDLLAQLTNTPPPPETPTRTIMRRVKIWTPLVALLGIVFVIVQAFRPLPDAELALGAKKGFAFEGDKPSFAWPEEGQSAAKVVGAGEVGTSGAQKPVPTASVAKVMTAWVILKNHPLKVGEQGEMITMDPQSEKEAGAEDESRVNVKAGQKFSEYDMLRMLLIPSGNNIARQLARWDSGSEEAFVKKMNDAAKELGMTNTVYTDPSGLQASTKSTASDQVKLAEVAIKNKVIRDITQQPNADIPIDGGAGGTLHINNNNDTLLVKRTGVLGLKTGSSGPAGGALMWAARRTIGDKEFLIVGATMDQHFKGLDPNAENSLLMVKNKSYAQITAIQKALNTTTVVKKGDVVGYVDDGLDGRTPVVTTKDVTAVGWAGFTTKFSLSDAGRKIPHSAKAGTEVGELTVGSGADAVKVPVVLKTALAEPSFGSKLTRLG
ncbi:D-alanyl-D-alanine carboxypeptidase [Streptomyces sp. NPDC053048]|uniref:D-alanyl-D-alanine carboxypeptidase n=1 Tax=Streptomyces sp. NPDC053048 TaxID=3365694 RepID=UPI0037D35643